MRHLVQLVLALSCFVAPSAQDSVPESAEELLELGRNGAFLLLAREEPRADDLRAELNRSLAKFEKNFERAAHRAWKKRRTREIEARLDELRGVIETHARNQELTKATIESVCDPARDELLQLTFVSPAEAFAARAGLEEESGRLRRITEDQLECYDWIRQASDVLREAAIEYDLQLGPEPLDWDAELDFLVLLAGCDSRRGRQTLLDNRTPKGIVSPEELSGTLLLNRWRVAFAQDVYAIDHRLCGAARDHSKDMAELDFFSHTSPVEGKETFGQRAGKFKTSASSENIARGASTGEGAILQWWYSPGHHRNMLGDGARTGLGRHENHWTQLFGR